MGSARIAVIGAGAWGIALAIQAARAGARVHLWARRPETLSSRRTLPRLPDASLPERITLSADMPERADAILFAVPTQHLRDICARVPPVAPMIACCKGVELSTCLLPTQIMAQVHPTVAHGVLSGPNFAHEIAAGLPAASVLACDSAVRARALGDLLTTPSFRLYASDDPTGVQVGGAAKNVIAIAAGATIGADMGENARAALMTRSIAELGRLSHALGGRAETLSGLAGIGDLILTCTGGASRNQTLGLALGRGESLASIMARGNGVIEGVTTAPALLELARAHGVSVPVIETVALLLEGTIDLSDARARLLNRPVGQEFARHQA
ncbi:NAD(P)H-dependent glycerol-3-phosphate dehydrogenase [Novacetimonas pomaceti]|uniref:NAD(P)H-dependent glycerol-3-phosphate dehydrogenase n=1 Tax=Novacetimonas pomaceti TaxID=2021998 RepID=UPI001C2CDF6E|nr:NAD(P)H-dependent glycerol-3-phosphate dehydrogenase [Novacetimonas pomaceti]MBV1833160.1 NAD(P)-dependent glycerol-3-phosphate dehydrogenase [Novacetimonas pomaceti]